MRSESHVDLDVPAHARRDVARVLLGAAAGLGLDPAVVAATGDGFRVPAEVFHASGLELETPPPGLIELLADLGRRARKSAAAAEGPATAAAVEVPDATTPAAEDVAELEPVEVPAPPKRKRKT